MYGALETRELADVEIGRSAVAGREEGGNRPDDRGAMGKDIELMFIIERSLSSISLAKSATSGNELFRNGFG